MTNLKTFKFPENLQFKKEQGPVLITHIGQ